MTARSSNLATAGASAFAPLRLPMASEPPVPAGQTLFIACAEVDRFAGLRRTVGYSFANRLLAAICDRIAASLPGCEVGRAGRSLVEFAFPARSQDVARAQLMAMCSRVGRDIDLDGCHFDLTLTVGVADTRGLPISEAMIDLAEAALAEAQRGRHRIVFADGAETGPAMERLAIIGDLHAAAARDQLQLVYQPKLRSRTATIECAEALLRWHHPTLGSVSPATFIPLAEETGSIRALTEWVVERAVADQALLAAGGSTVRLDVNISGLLLADLDFTAWVLSRLGGRGTGVGFEITETAMIADPDGALANLRAFSEAGVRLAIDDYGSGFSSLSYLQKLPVNELKIDRSFIAGLARTNRDPLLVRSTIDLAHALDMEVTAEGVDTPEALALLQVMGCDMVQGFLISHPLPIAELLAFVREERQSEVLAALPSFGARLRQGAQ
jgi:EAL domain-containing protein (putative c-di-GMP-specific phosphodiesterase class I)/GGDEF domain-containing protein